jgi:ribose 5-phosphate isomerase B
VRVAVAFDHKGVHLRDAVLEVLSAHEVIDLGTDTDAVRIDYPDKARELGEAIQSGDAERGVLVCGSGVGASVAACKLARELVAAFLGADFNTTDARYAARLEKVSQMERMMKSGEVTAA